MNGKKSYSDNRFHAKFNLGFVLRVTPEDLQKIKHNAQKELKQAKRDRNKTLISDLTEKNKTLDYQTDIFKNLADSIAWQMLNGQHYFYRRLFTHETGEKNLNDK